MPLAHFLSSSLIVSLLTPPSVTYIDGSGATATSVSIEFIALATSIAWSSARREEGDPSTATRMFRNTSSYADRRLSTLARSRLDAALGHCDDRALCHVQQPLCEAAEERPGESAEPACAAHDDVSSKFGGRRGDDVRSFAMAPADDELYVDAVMRS